MSVVSQRTRPRSRTKGPAPARAMPLGMSPRGWLLSGWALLPLRAFLAVVFCYAGLQKLMNPAFLSWTAAGGLHQQMIGFERTSPIGALVGRLVGQSTLLGVGIALGELAIAIGMAIGLWTRLAAIGGMVLSFSLFLTASWHSFPWYTGADLVYFFAFIPFVVAGAGGVLSVDAWIAKRAAKEAHLDDPEVVVVPFAVVQTVCGSFDKGRCKAVPGRTCAPAGCPYLEGERRSLPAGRRPDAVDRRAVVLGGIMAAGAATVGAVAAGAAAGGGRLVGAVKLSGGAKSLTGGGGTSSHGTVIGPAKDVPVGKSALFTVPTNAEGANPGDPGLVIHESQGSYVAYDAVCPHAGCTVGFSAPNSIIYCPCHGSLFQVSDGAVLQGPAPHGLTALTVDEVGGQLYIK